MSLQPGQSLAIRAGTFHVAGGVEAHGLTDVTVSIAGRLLFSPDTASWPHYANTTTHHRAGLAFWNVSGLTLTSPTRGELNGNGAAWWSYPGIGYLVHAENRPRLLTITNSSSILIERLLLADSPYWTAFFHHVDGLTVRHVGIVARRTPLVGHGLLDLSAFNTDGIDVAGRNVHVSRSDARTPD